MNKLSIFVILAALTLVTACGGQPTTVVETTVPDSSAETLEDNETIIEPSHPSETVAQNCLGDEVSPIGQSIAEDYEFASYEQVMTWFCNGAEFEDILVALETESQTGVPADEMLQMLADGFTWEEIWQVIGLSD